MDDLYAVLGISHDATSGEISKAYRDLARKYHPDSTQEKDVQAAIARFKEVVQAYEVLNDKFKKSEYDRKYKRPSPKRPAKKEDRAEWLKKKDPNMGNIRVPEPPKFDIWGRPLTEAEKQQWIKDAMSDMFGTTYPVWGKVSSRTSDYWFKDVFTQEYNTPPPPPPKRPPWRDKACEKFVDVWESQYSKPPKKEEHEEPYSEEFYKKYGVENF